MIKLIDARQFLEVARSKDLKVIEEKLEFYKSSGYMCKVEFKDGFNILYVKRY